MNLSTSSMLHPQVRLEETLCVALESIKRVLGGVSCSSHPFISFCFRAEREEDFKKIKIKFCYRTYDCPWGGLWLQQLDSFAFLSFLRYQRACVLCRAICLSSPMRQRPNSCNTQDGSLLLLSVSQRFLLFSTVTVNYVLVCKVL